MSQYKKYLSTFLSLKYLMVVMSVIGAILLLVWVLKYSYYGIDFTDESLYLLSIKNPFIYDSSLSQFGFIYHFLYVFLDGSISALRQANILLTFGLSWCLSYTFLHSLLASERKDFIALHVISFGLSSCVISTFVVGGSWLSTPSYNSLVFQSLLITGIGLIHTKKTMDFKSILGCVVVGFGGWLSFMAKPSSALALAVGVSIYFIMSRKISIRLILITTLSTLTFLLLSALLIDGSPLVFLQRIQRGIEFAQLIGGGHTLNQIFRLDDFWLNSKDKIVGYFVIGTLLCSVWGAWSERKIGLYTSLLFSASFFALVVLLVSGEINIIGWFGDFFGLLFFCVTLATILLGLIFGRFKTLKNITSSGWATFFLFILMPYIYVFGTGNNYWRIASSVAIFWLLAGLPFLGVMVRERGTWLIALPLVFSTQAITAVLIQTGLEHPYRQPEPLSHNETPIEIGGFQKSTLILSNDYVSYLSNVIELTKESGFRYGTPMIDLTGQSPGLLYAIGAEAIGNAWIIGGYPGSLNLATALLNRVSCKNIAIAWVLFEPDGPRSIPSDLMLNLGLKFPENYKKIATWKTAKGAGGYEASRTQELYQPLDVDMALKMCEGLSKK